MAWEAGRVWSWVMVLLYLFSSWLILFTSPPAPLRGVEARVIVCRYFLNLLVTSPHPRPLSETERGEVTCFLILALHRLKQSHNYNSYPTQYIYTPPEQSGPWNFSRTWRKAGLRWIRWVPIRRQCRRKRRYRLRKVLPGGKVSLLRACRVPWQFPVSCCA